MGDHGPVTDLWAKFIPANCLVLLSYEMLRLRRFGTPSEVQCVRKIKKNSVGMSPGRLQFVTFYVRQ